jgi:hypothetical protein
MKISNQIAYIVKSAVVGTDYLPITDSETLDLQTKTATLDAISNFVLGGLSPDLGGVLAITQLEPVTAETSPSVVANALSPDYEVGRYECLYLDINGHQYLLKTPNVIIGEGGVTLTDDDFIDFPVNEGQQGPAGANGANGTNGTNGTNADMTRTSATSLLIAGSGSKTATYTASTNLGWLIGTRLRFANDASNYMEGAVTAVSSTSVTITVDNSAGSGTYTSWNIGIAGDKGVSGSVAGAIVVENTSGSLVITQQELANLDYILSFQVDGDKIFVSGSVTNNTGGSVGPQTIFSFVDTNYETGLITNFYNGVNNSVADKLQLFQFTGVDFNLSGTMENGKVAYINAFYYIN